MLAALSLFGAFLLAEAAPSQTGTGTTIQLTRKNTYGSTDAERVAWLVGQENHLKSKYGGHHSSKRASTASVPLTNQNVDFSYFGSVQVGTPAQKFNVILDTGSSDLWLASSDCLTGCSEVTNAFDTSKSSTYQDSGLPIDIVYGSGEVAGKIGTETVNLAGFTVTKQPFGVIDQLTSGVINGGELSGLMGLGWTPLAQTAANPWWLNLVNANAWNDPLFAFYLTRFADDPSAQEIEPGGSMDIGFTDSQYYTGSINYVPLSAKTYWLIPLDDITIGGSKTGSTGQAAIDTGTSLIGGPTAAMAALYSKIPGAQKGTGQLSSYYLYPCSTKVSVSMTFGGQAYTIDPVDFSRPVDSLGRTCAGAFFGLDLSSGSSVQWIVGDAFLKNVYTVFRANPASVGFATVNANAGNGGGGGSSNTNTGLPTLSVGLPTDTSLPNGGGTVTRRPSSSTPSAGPTENPGSNNGAVAGSAGFAGVLASIIGAFIASAWIL